MDDHVRSQGDGLLEIWRHESVVHDDVDFLAVANFADSFDIAEGHQRVGGRLDIDHAGVFAQGAFYVSDVGSVYIREFHSEVCQNLIEQALHATIKIVAADHVVTGFEHRADSIDGRHTAGKHS